MRASNSKNHHFLLPFGNTTPNHSMFDWEMGRWKKKKIVSSSLLILRRLDLKLCEEVLDPCGTAEVFFFLCVCPLKLWENVDESAPTASAADQKEKKKKKKNSGRGK